ncbi:3'-5' exonuclease [Geopseudomonas aromaticivorans]
MDNADNLEELEAARAAAIAAGRCFSKTRLRDEFRMKPRPGVEPVRFYKSDFGRKFGVYRIADCEPMAPYRAPTPSELRALDIGRLRRRIADDDAGEIALRWLAADALCLDTETTGLGESAQIIELSIVDSAGAVVFETRLRPTVAIEAEAEEVHGITAADLTDAPTWADVADRVEALLAGRPVLIFNANFDCRLLEQTAEAFGRLTEWVRALDARCVMRLAARAYGATNRYGTISLADAMWQAGAQWRGRAHTAAADALAAIDVVRAIADRRRQREVELEALLRAEP